MSEEVYYTRRFNFGYVLKKNSPEILKAITERLQGNPEYKQALENGAAQYEKERAIALVRDQREKSKERSKDRGR